MSRIAAIDPNQTEGATRQTLAGVQALLGVTPNLFRVAAQAPSSLTGLVGLTGAMARGSLGPRVREAIALAIAESNGCSYCLSAHTVLGKGAGLTPEEISEARRGEARDPKIAAVLQLARDIVMERGRLSDRQLAGARGAGLSDPEIVEVVGHVMVNVFTNYLNLVADTDIDFPVVRPGNAADAA